ncbi:hypothetical protein DFR33_11073 [Bradymonas sediminis]|nr:hypothetical protein DFR33_11073 [Bradymonas sediminis]
MAEMTPFGIERSSEINGNSGGERLRGRSVNAGFWGRLYGAWQCLQ